MANPMNVAHKYRVAVPDKSGNDPHAVMNKNPNPAFDNPRTMGSNTIPVKFGEKGFEAGKMGSNNMRSPVRLKEGKAQMPTSTTVKKSKNNYNQAGKTKQR